MDGILRTPAANPGAAPIWVMPVGYRPSTANGDLVWVTYGSGIIITLNINPAGEVALGVIPGNAFPVGSWIYLDVGRFYADG